MKGLKSSAKVIDIDLGFKEIVNNFKELKGSYVAIGLWGQGDDPATNVAALGTVHEFGSQKMKIPARPFMRRTYEHNVQQIADEATKLLKELSDRIINSKTVLMGLGAFYEGLMKETFVEGGFQVLKAQTIARKGSDTPLIDTGNLRSSIMFRIFVKNKELYDEFMKKEMESEE